MIVIHQQKISLMIKENVALDTSQEGPCLVFFMKSGSAPGIISVVNEICWAATTISALGSLCFRQIHFKLCKERRTAEVEMVTVMLRKVNS